MKKSLASHIYLHLAKYIYVAISIISIIAGYTTYRWYLNRELQPLDTAMQKMTGLSQFIMLGVLQSSQHQITYRIQRHPEILTDKVAMRELLLPFKAALKTVAGVGYALTDKSALYGEYIYESSNLQLINESMGEIYAKYHTDYTQRPWYSQVSKHGKPTIFSPQVSWVGSATNLVTYAYPVIINNKIAMVGVFDVSMSIFNSYIDAFRCRHYCHGGSLKVYYISMPHSGSHGDMEYYLLTSSESAITYAPTINALNNIYHLRNNYSNWHYLNGSLYRSFSLLDGGLNFIIKFDLTSVFLWSIIWLLGTYLLSQFLMQLIRGLVTRKLILLVGPITDISKQAQNLAQTRLSISFAADSANEIEEIDTLVSSLEVMRLDLHQLIQKEKELGKTNAELDFAARIQSKFIPGKLDLTVVTPELSIKIYARYHAANKLSGDIYDVVESGKVIYVLLGDATGKDVTAALFALFVLSRFRVLCERQLMPDKILADLNNYLCAMDAENMFISAICIKLDLENGLASVSNAGHEMALVFDHDMQQLRRDYSNCDLVLGVIPDYEYGLFSRPFSELNSAYIYTDGVSEAMDANGRLFDRERVVACIQLAGRQGGSVEVCDLLLEECTRFEAGSGSSDDKTIISINWYESE